MPKMNRLFTALALVIATVAFAASARADETLRYDWHLRGALSWIARVKVPTSGSGILATSPNGSTLHSQLRVNGGGRDYLEYRSVMDSSAQRTLSTMNGYSFGSRSEQKQTVYDYNGNVARLSDRDDGTVENKTRPLPIDDARDVLTTIAYLRANASSINGPVTTQVFSDGKPYRVVIQPQGIRTAEWQNRQVPARMFRIVAAPGEAKKFPGMTVWLSEDARRLPLRIVLDQRFASLDLTLRGV